ncbi:MAG: hypothetical protein ACTSW2_06575 [Alphaproteobacteria bacterium]
MAAIALTGLASCGTDQGNGGGLDLGLSLFGSDSSKRHLVDPAKFPFHVKAAIAAAVMRQRGIAAEQVTQKLGVTGSETISPEKRFDYAGFAVKNIDLLRFETPEDEPLNRKIVGLVHFEDGTNRHAAMAFNISYRLGDTSPIAITAANIAPTFPRASVAAAYIVSAKAVVDGISSVQEYAEFYGLVRDAARPVMQRASSLPADDYVIFVFFLDRLPEGDQVQAGVSTVREGTASFTDDTRYIVFDGGWVVAMIPGNFAPGPDKAFWIKAMHTPAAVADKKTKPEVVGLFSSDPAATAPTN